MDDKTLRLTQQDISLILNALSAGPYATVAPLINKITAQSNGDLDGTNTSGGGLARDSDFHGRLNGDHMERSEEHNNGTVARIAKTKRADDSTTGADETGVHKARNS